MATKNRNKALDAIRTLREKGAVSATFHPDGSLASVVLSPLAAKSSQAARVLPFEQLAKPAPRTDVDALDDLPAYEG